MPRQLYLRAVTLSAAVRASMMGVLMYCAPSLCGIYCGFLSMDVLGFVCGGSDVASFLFSRLARVCVFYGSCSAWALRVVCRLRARRGLCGTCFSPCSSLRFCLIVFRISRFIFVGGRAVPSPLSTSTRFRRPLGIRRRMWHGSTWLAIQPLLHPILPYPRRLMSSPAGLLLLLMV